MKSKSLRLELDFIPKGRINIEDILKEQLADLKKDNKDFKAKGLVWDCLERKK